MISPGPWMSRRETADYLRVSVRHLDRLGLARSYAGSRPLYSKASVDAFLAQSHTTPKPKRAQVAPEAVALVLPTRRRRNVPPDAWLANIRTALRIAA